MQTDIHPHREPRAKAIHGWVRSVRRLKFGAKTFQYKPDCAMRHRPRGKGSAVRDPLYERQQDVTFSGFIEPDRTLETISDPAERLGIKIYSGFKAHNAGNFFRGQNRIYDRIIDKQSVSDLRYEDQCSTQYYFDLVRALRDFNGQFSRVAEVGVFMGGSSIYLAGCMDSFEFDLDLIDLSDRYLLFAYERVRRSYPEAAKRIRLFQGDLPTYVRHVMLSDRANSYIVHHDGAHDFNQVVKDMAALYYVKEKLTAVIAQDTHLRGTVGHMNFVDLALHAVFGADLNYAPIGMVHQAGSPLTAPNQYQGNYFMPGAPEGLVLPMLVNQFRYPHPELKIDDFLPPLLQQSVAVA
jgi:hypothetical protein